MKAVKERTAADGGKLGKELLGLFAIFCGLLVILSLATFDSRDPWLNHVVSGSVKLRNKAGLFGAYLAGLLYDIFGAASWVLPAWFCLVGARRILGLAALPWWRWTGFLFLALCVCLAGAASDLGHVEIFAKGALPQGAGNVSTHGGGIIGHIFFLGLVGWMGATGTFLVWLFALLLAFQMLTGISWLTLLVEGSRSLYSSLCANLQTARERRAERRTEREARRESERREAKAAPVPQGYVPEPLPVEVSGPAPVAEPPEAASFEPEPSGPDPFGPDPFGPEPSAPSPSGPDPFAPDYVFNDPSDRSGSEADFDFGAQPEEAPAPPARGRDAREEADGPALPPSAPLSLERPQLVHPALIHEQAPQAEKKLSMAAKAAAFFKPSRKKEEDDGLPPWVRDFEEGRIGVPSDAPDLSGSVQADHGALPQAASSPVFSPASSVPSGALCEGQESARGADASETDEDLLSILWGKADVREDKGAGESFAPEAPSTGDSPAVAIPQETPVAENGPAHGGADASPDKGRDESRDASPAEDEDSPLVSARTAAALKALRTVGSVPPDSALYASNPEYADPALAVLSEAEKNESAAPVAGVAAEGGAGASVKPSPDEDIRIFEAPPVEAAAQPGLARSLTQTLVQRVKRVVPLPPLDLLEAAPPSKGATPRSVLEDKGRSLMTCLKDFGIQGELVGITPGPVVTMFEVRPAPGVRVSRIANLSDDLALALKAVAVRIQAPVPGTDTVGIEIPNETRETVCLKELLGSELFRQSKSLLTLALGKDISGLPAVADLATMPHLLVAGATGAGKSVGINSIILSLIYKARPDQVKLLLVDPKRVEMAIYADLPHLVHPVVTEMQLAKNALEWAVSEMEQRYNAIARAGVRNITDYNAKVEGWKDAPPEGMEDLERMPYLVVIIDELADLMLVAAKEVETSIVRLAQLARAAGIHLILATQRPSVDVVTGLIKANFPCRISFQVTSKHDSRTILDTVGAEQLLGRGDMLFKPAGGKFRRMHGAFVSDKNVNTVVDYWKRQLKPEYRVDFSDWAPEGASGGVLSGNGGGGDVSADPLYNEAVEFVRQQGKASISLIQRKFRIGFNKAARFVEQMEQDGIIGPADGSRPRMVIR